MYLDFDGHYCPSEARTNSNGAAPGECYYYRTFSRYKIGILLHLAGILPASVIAVIQFTPFIRQKWIVAHRIGGYVAIALYTISLAGVLMIARRALGGSIDVQAWCGFAGFGVLACFGLSWYNIKRLQIEQHRAWMLRGWFYVRATLSAPQAVSLTPRTGRFHHHSKVHHDSFSVDHIEPGLLCCLDLRKDPLDILQ